MTGTTHEAAENRGIASTGVYQGTPSEVLAERLARFRSAHPYIRRRLAGEMLEYIRCGRRERTLLLLTGLLGRGETWFPLIEPLERHYRILSPTYAGLAGWAQLVQTLLAMLDAEGVTRADLVGQSFGGLVAQGLVREQPGRVRSMTLSHTVVPRHNSSRLAPVLVKLLAPMPLPVHRALWRRKIGRITKKATLQIPAAAFWETYRNELLLTATKKEILAYYAYVLDLMSCYAFSAEELGGWEGKILVIESDNDPAVSETERARLRAVYPQARVVTFQGAGHGSLQAEPERYCCVVRKFLDEIGQS